MNDPSAFDVFARMLPPLALIVGSLLLLRRWAHKGRGPGVGTGPRVLGRTGVTRSSVVAVVQVGGRRFLVGAGDQSVTLLAELDQDASIGDGTAIDLTQNSADTELAPVRPAFTTDRPWMGLIHRLQQMTVRTHIREPIHGADS